MVEHKHKRVIITAAHGLPFFPPCQEEAMERVKAARDRHNAACRYH